MQNDFKEDVPNSGGTDEIPVNTEIPAPSSPIRQPGLFSRWINSLVQMGLGESMLRIGTNVFSVLAIGVVIFLVQAFYRQTPNQFSENSGQAAGPVGTVVVNVNSMPALDVPVISGISRAAQLHTNVPSRPRQEISNYTVQDGDTVLELRRNLGLNRKLFCGQITICYWMIRIH
ncbi:MAG: hypothetical protein IPN58_06290 [Anaerolineales bacterium]|nr:hypothetical protein [Anaerolineales bacterium]